MTTREVTIDGGSPWGFRITGGADLQQPIRISRVNPGSKAASKGIREGDIITSINGQSTKDKTNAETHLLLKTAGDVLKLGLNEEGVSPKKRQYRTVQQETHSFETIKRTNATIHVVTTTKKETQIETPNNNIEEKNIKVNGGSHNYQGQDCFSEKSTISSNYSSPASTPSTLTDTQGGDQQLSERKDNNGKEGVQETKITMPDTSKSRKRRRNNGGNKKKSIKNVNIETQKEEIIKEENYRVESPKTVQNSKKKGQVVKSKSLDDEESLKIQEISTETFQVETTENNNVIIEDLDEPKNDSIHTLHIDSLETNSKENKYNISPEDESKLRCFLEGLNLPSTPEESTNHYQVKEKESSETIRAKRSKKREELAQYFLPVYQNPRYLDVISEENSDQSDKEIKENEKIKHPKIDRYIPTLPIYNHKKVETVLVEREDVELPIISDTCTISMAEQSSEGVEVVFLDDNDDTQSEDEPEIPSSQLTPPPTPDCDSSSSEEPIEPIERTCCLTPKPSRSPSHDRDDSSSRGTSLCTTICSNLPKSLRELCLDKLISLPFGKDVLEELANVSMSLQELTNNIPSERLTNDSINFGIAEKKMKPEEKWVGIQTEDNPQVIVCLSPTQKEHLDSTKIVKREADSLLDLHNKFIERSYYSDTETIRENRPLTSIGENISKNKKSWVEDDVNPRLHAKNLTEWLQLAKSTTNSPLTSEVKQTNNHNRRRSLPNEIYVQQMQSIIQKEKEIQQELEKLEEEKRRLQNEMEIPKFSFKFDPSKYHISKNEDIAILNEELKRPKLKLTQPSTENFRKQMYDEYLQQIAERNERKNQKVIKISSHQDLQEEVHQCQGIKDEFMCKLKQKRFCHRESDDDVNTDASNGNGEKSDECESVMVIDGEKVSDSKKLPKHLKEFVDITRQASENLENSEEGRGEWTKRLELQWMLCDLLDVLTFNLEY